MAAALGAETFALSLVPTAQALRTASEEGVALSLPTFFASPEEPPETVTYARPGERLGVRHGQAGEGLKLDVWRPRREEAATRDPGKEGRLSSWCTEAAGRRAAAK